MNYPNGPTKYPHTSPFLGQGMPGNSQIEQKKEPVKQPPFTWEGTKKVTATVVITLVGVAVAALIGWFIFTLFSGLMGLGNDFGREISRMFRKATHDPAYIIPLLIIACLVGWILRMLLRSSGFYNKSDDN